MQLNDADAQIKVCNLTMAYGAKMIQRDLNFAIAKGSIFVIMGGSGCGKSTLLRHMIGLKPPYAGDIIYGEHAFWQSDIDQRESLMRHFGVTYQDGALFSSMSLAENIALPLQEYTQLEADDIAEIVNLKLALVGLAGYEEYYPAEISGGMRKRAGIARAIALDPDIIFFDEPSAGLDPISAKRLDNLILELRDSLQATVVIVTHELESIFAIADDSVYLDEEQKTMLATGNPRRLRDETDEPKLKAFLSREDWEGEWESLDDEY